MRTKAGSKNTGYCCSVHTMCFSWTSCQVMELLNWVVNGKNAGLKFLAKPKILVHAHSWAPVLLCDAGLETAPPRSSLVAQKAALRESKERWCQNGTRWYQGKAECTGSTDTPLDVRQTQLACALTHTLPAPLASSVQILKGHEKPNNSKDVFVTSDPQISEQLLILSILQMRK